VRKAATPRSSLAFFGAVWKEGPALEREVIVKDRHRAGGGNGRNAAANKRMVNPPAGSFANPVA